MLWQAKECGLQGKSRVSDVNIPWAVVRRGELLLQIEPHFGREKYRFGLCLMRYLPGRKES